MSGSWIQQIPTLPLEPGVYIFYGKNDEVLYVGKSKCLRKRVKNYADLKGDSRPFIPHLHEEAHRLEFLVTDTEKEALLLENQLIVKLNPKYNILFRQDTTYISIKITIKHPFPRLMLTRQVKKDGALYFGPYTSGKALRETLHFIKSFFRIRTCSNSEFKRRKRACLLYQIDRCTAPCVGKVSEKEYKKKVEDLVRFLQGKNRIILDELEKKMARASEKLDFERAIKYRDQIKALEATLEKQKVLSLDQKDYDVVAIFQKDGKAAIQMLFIRGGKLLTSHAKLVTSWEKPETLLGSFLKHYYLSNVYIPQEILSSHDFEDRNLLEDILSEKKEQKVVIKVPQKGQKRKLVNLALKNCRCSFQNLKKREDQTLELLSKTQNLLGLKSLPWRIECFDISNIQGAYSVGSKVCFEMAEPLKEEYRKYKIKHFTSPNDFGMMEEVLYRRFQRGLLEGDLPDLVMVDGGKGQLGVAQKVFDQLSIQGIDLIGIAKARKPGEKEKIFFPDREEPLILPPHEPVLHLLQRVRDEAHRFAIEYHRNLRDRDFLRNKGSSGKVP